jgi:hypothetical protein
MQGRHVEDKIFVDPDCIVEWKPQEVWLVWILFPKNIPLLLEMNEQVLKVLVQDQSLAIGSCPTLIVASVTVGVKCTLAREYRTLRHLHLQSFQLADMEQTIHKDGIVVKIDGIKTRFGQDFFEGWRFGTFKHVIVHFAISFLFLLVNDDCSTPQTKVCVTSVAVHCRTAAGVLHKWRE